jgi:tRNA A-37 threonylcarbamoyl transferase component Bud32/DNA-binding NarL/FixJ family response regulator
VVPRIFIAEDDAQYCRWLRHYIESIWPESLPSVGTLADLARLLTQNRIEEHDLVVLSASFADHERKTAPGIRLLRNVRRQLPRAIVVAIATHGNELSAARAMRLGAFDYLPREQLTGALLKRHLRMAMRRARQRVIRRTAAALESASAPAAQPEVPAGTPLIAGYTFLKFLGQSANAEVWLAECAALDQKVALKISKAEQSDDENMLFGREYQALAALDHPGIVDIYDYGICEQREYLAMEFFARGDLRQRLQKPLLPRHALRYIRKLCEALAPVHQARMMHLDIKPGNIMLREDDSPVLIDFGLVKHVGTAAKSTLLGIRRGSPYYMSPEQVLGQPLDPRSDIYSLGVLLFEMFTGKRPFNGTTAMELMDGHVHGQRPPLPPALAAFEPLLERMMAKSPGDRPADANALLALLLQFQAVTTSVPDIRLHASA